MDYTSIHYEYLSFFGWYKDSWFIDQKGTRRVRPINIITDSYVFILLRIRFSTRLMSKLDKVLLFKLFKIFFVHLSQENMSELSMIPVRVSRVASSFQFVFSKADTLVTLRHRLSTETPPPLITSPERGVCTTSTYFPVTTEETETLIQLGSDRLTLLFPSYSRDLQFDQ